MFHRWRNDNSGCWLRPARDRSQLLLVVHLSDNLYGRTSHAVQRISSSQPRQTFLLLYLHDVQQPQTSLQVSFPVYPFLYDASINQPPRLLSPNNLSRRQVVTAAERDGNGGICLGPREDGGDTSSCVVQMRPRLACSCSYFCFSCCPRSDAMARGRARTLTVR